MRAPSPREDDDDIELDLDVSGAQREEARLRKTLALAAEDNEELLEKTAALEQEVAASRARERDMVRQLSDLQHEGLTKHATRELGGCQIRDKRGGADTLQDKLKAAEEERDNALRERDEAQGAQEELARNTCATILELRGQLAELNSFAEDMREVSEELLTRLETEQALSAQLSGRIQDLETEMHRAAALNSMYDLEDATPGIAGGGIGTLHLELHDHELTSIEDHEKLQRLQNKFNLAFQAQQRQLDEAMRRTCKLANDSDLNLSDCEWEELWQAFRDGHDALAACMPNAVDVHICCRDLSATTAPGDASLPGSVSAEICRRRDSACCGPPEIQLLASRDIKFHTWYPFRVCESGEERFYLRRYKDFQKLDRLLRATATPGRQLPSLPESSLLGIRHRLGILSFEAKRKKGLQDYINSLLLQSTDLKDEPALDGFFRKNRCFVHSPLGVGDECVAMSPTTMRRGELLDTEYVGEFPIDTVFRVLEFGIDRRIRVIATGDVTDGGVEGWISVRARDNTPLVRKVFSSGQEASVGLIDSPAGVD